MERISKMKRSTFILIALLVIFLPVDAGAELADLIPGLYGGNCLSTLVSSEESVPPHKAHYLLTVAASINQLNENISAQIGTYPFSSFSGGFTFEFDKELGTFLKTTGTLGPLFSEWARTLGKGKFNFNVSYTFFEYDDFEGTDLDNLQARALHDADDPDQREFYELDDVLLNIDLDIDVQILALIATYGVTDRLDISIFVPVVRVDMKVASHAEIIASPDNPFPDAHQFTESPDDAASDSATGIGDVVLRAKYHYLKSDTNNLAGALLIKTETGNERDFLGTGDTTVRPFLVYSRSFGAFTPHVNLGYEFNLDTSDENSVEYVIGSDYGGEKFSVTADVIGSHEINGDGIGNDIVSGSLGVKWSPVKNLIFSANALVPLNDSGLRSDLITTLAVEYSL